MKIRKLHECACFVPLPNKARHKLLKYGVGELVHCQFVLYSWLLSQNLTVHTVHGVHLLTSLLPCNLPHIAALVNTLVFGTSAPCLSE